MVNHFCDCCGDMSIIIIPLEVKYPDGEKITINLCLECNKKIKDSRKHFVAEMLRILLEDET